MTELEAQEFIDNFLKELFPKWNPTDLVMKLWYGKLLKCDSDGSKKGFLSWYDETTRPGREPVIGIFNMVKVGRKIKPGEFDPVLTFALAKLENLNRQSKFFSPHLPLPASHELENISERCRKRANVLYGGEHVVVRHWEKDPEQPEFQEVQE